MFVFIYFVSFENPDDGREQTNRETQDELQWIVAQRLLSALTIPGFS